LTQLKQCNLLGTRIASNASEVRVILDRLTTDVAHHGSTGAHHFVTAILFYEFLLTLPTGSEIHKIWEKEDQDTVKSSQDFFFAARNQCKGSEQTDSDLIT
jgi:uncharacterized protein (DUF2267 family)